MHPVLTGRGRSTRLRWSQIERSKWSKRWKSKQLERRWQRRSFQKRYIGLKVNDIRSNSRVISTWNKTVRIKTYISTWIRLRSKTRPRKIYISTWTNKTWVKFSLRQHKHPTWSGDSKESKFTRTLWSTHQTVGSAFSFHCQLCQARRSLMTRVQTPRIPKYLH